MGKTDNRRASMRHWIATAVLTAAVAACCPFAQAQLQPDAQDKGVPAAKPAPIPVKAVVLFSSGVGYFEHFGPVDGAASTELRFKTQQINDILKSLVLQDLDGGK